jgi:uncharacterized protein (TIGR00730 family)
MNITVYLGAREGNEPVFRETAAEVGKWIAEAGHRLIYGGSGIGLMGVLADAAMESGGEVIGVEPQFFIDDGFLHEGITKTIPTETMAERRLLMMEMGDAFIALPGGIGTLDEISEVIVMAALGKHKKPCILYNKNGYYDLLRRMFDRMTHYEFMAEDARDRIVFADTLEDIQRAVGDCR